MQAWNEIPPENVNDDDCPASIFGGPSSLIGPAGEPDAVSAVAVVAGAAVVFAGVGAGSAVKFHLGENDIKTPFHSRSPKRSPKPGKI